jgi:membrane-associated phospholipid phosphatase
MLMAVNGIRFHIKAIVSILVLLSIFSDLSAQKRDSLHHKVYHLNYSVDIPVTTVATATALWGLSIVKSKSPLDSVYIVGLDANDINRFDRSATWQDPEFAPAARTVSDVFMGISHALPFLLFIDKEIRKDWADVLLLMLQSQAITGNLYSWAGAVHFNRIRPMVYIPEVPWDERTEARNKNSFYSGHTSMSTSACFFAAKVYSDYHPELGNKKYLLYSLALIPSVTTGFFRYKGLKHFPTDVITGIVIGASAGILVPHLHKRTGSNLAVVPFAGQVNGLALSYKF